MAEQNDAFCSDVPSDKKERYGSKRRRDDHVNGDRDGNDHPPRKSARTGDKDRNRFRGQKQIPVTPVEVESAGQLKHLLTFQQDFSALLLGKTLLPVGRSSVNQMTRLRES